MRFVTEIQSIKKWMFFWMFFAGTTSIIVLKYINIHQVFVTSIPVVIILIYYFLLPKKNETLENNNQYGDSLYYLGFLFTLVSLAYSLFEFSLMAKGIDIIISNLGIALSTTIAGMVGRIVYLQRSEIGFTEEDVRVEFNRTTLHLKEELSSALVDINLVREQTKSILFELQSEFKKRSEKEVEQLNIVYESHRDTVEDFSKYYKKELTTLIDDVKYFCEVSTQEAEKNQAENLELYNSNINDLTENLKVVVAEITSSLKNFEDGQTIHTKRLGEVLDNTIGTMDDFNSKLESFKSEPNKILEKINEGLENFEKVIALINSKFERNVGIQIKLNDNLGTINQRTNSLVKEYEKFSETIKDVNSNTQKIDASGVNKAIEQFQETLNNFQKHTEQFESYFAKSLKRADDYNQSIEKEMVKSKDYVGQVYQSMLQMTELITSNFKNQNQIR